MCLTNSKHPGISIAFSKSGCRWFIGSCALKGDEGETKHERLLAGETDGGKRFLRRRCSGRPLIIGFYWPPRHSCFLKFDLFIKKEMKFETCSFHHLVTNTQFEQNRTLSGKTISSVRFLWKSLKQLCGKYNRFIKELKESNSLICVSVKRTTLRGVRWLFSRRRWSDAEVKIILI